MPSKKKKYNARFPAGRIKKIMQTDEDVGKVAQAVPVIISRTLELFVESLLKRAMQITSAKNAKTLTPSHMKQCILSESRFDFLKDLVRGIPDVSSVDDEAGTPGGNISPGTTPTSVKSPSGFSCFQFRRISDSGSSKTLGTTSQLSPVSQAALPKFYKEIAIGSEDSKIEEEGKVEQPVMCRTPVIQHTGLKINLRPSCNEAEESPLKSVSAMNNTGQNNEKITNCIKNNEKRQSSSEDEEEEEDDDDDDEPQENGYHRLEIVTKTCPIDEDYDT